MDSGTWQTLIKKLIKPVTQVLLYNTSVRVWCCSVSAHTHTCSESFLCWNMFSHFLFPEHLLRPFFQTSCTKLVTLPWFASTRSPKRLDSNVKYVSCSALKQRHVNRWRRCDCCLCLTQWHHVNMRLGEWGVLSSVEQMRTFQGRLHYLNFLNPLLSNVLKCK